MPKRHLRTRTDIIEDLLDAIQEKKGRIKQTHLMYKANLSHAQLKPYLEDIIAKGFIKKINEESNIYIILTERGEKFAHKLQEIKKFERSIGL